MNATIMWQGAGWYAPRRENDEVRYYFCGDDPSQEPNTYPMGLGAPMWFSAAPDEMEVR